MQKYIIPIAIVIAGGFIGTALFMSRNAGEPAQNGSGDTKIDLSPVTNADHIRGNPDAELIVVEYSDYQCPYCQDFHNTMKQIVNDYGRDGKVAWVFRHYPIESLHPYAMGAAISAECVANLQGNDQFWNYTDTLFAGAPDALTPEALKASALALGAETSAYDTCINGDDASQAVRADITDGNRIAEVNPAEFGTPYSIIVSKSGTQFPIAGALRYDQVKAVIDTMLEEVQ